MSLSELLHRIPASSPTLGTLLAPERGAVAPPVRAEIFGAQRFAQHGQSLAEAHRSQTVATQATTFFPRLKNNMAVLREAHDYIGEQAGSGYDISPAAEWLLDNFHTIEAQLKEIHDGLPRSYFRTLPMLLDPPLAGLPRIYGVAWAFVAHTDGAFNEALLSEFLTAYQSRRELKLSELWALPTTLRVVLVENLRRLAERVATHKAAREVANLCFDHLAQFSHSDLQNLLILLAPRGVGPVFLAQLAHRQQDHRGAGEAGPQAVFEDWLASHVHDVAALQIQQVADQVADNLSVSNAITSLRAIGDADWPDIIARTSLLIQRMLTSPVFEAEDASTRDQTLHALEKLARRSGRSEAEVASTLLQLMHDAVPPGGGAPVAAHHWLRGSGRADLLRALGLPARAALALQYVVRRLAMPVYLLTLLVALVWLVNTVLQPGGQVLSATLLLTALLLLLPASEAVVAVVNRLISESAPPQHLPRLALLDGIPPAHRVMVVIPGMLTGPASARELAHRLHLHALANPEREAQFALLTDWADADTAHLPSDAGLLAEATQQIAELNALYPATGALLDGAPRFILLHRGRCFSETEQRWIGWERKRGKLEWLVAALATGAKSAFFDLGEGSRLAPNIQYLLTLDSDTQLPPGRLRDLVGVAAHPHNQPRLDASGRHVISGYSIFQPRVVTPLPAVKNFTRYHWLFAGQCGIDPYSAASSEVYQDLFSEGTFTGKGLLHVRAVHAVLGGRLPDGQVLSHDLLEGSLARCAAVSDITVVEDAPFHADVAASRVHRWTRGDWQLLPFLLQPVRYRLRAINRWKMLDNLRRSLVAPASLALLLLTLLDPVVSPWAALALVMTAFSAGPLMGAVASFSPSRDDIAKAHFYRAASLDLVRALWGGVWLLAQLLQQSVQALDAIGRALYRLLVSRRHLLQWTTAAVAQAQAKTGLAGIARQHWLEPVLALLLLGALLLAHTPSPGLAFVLCTLWAGAPVWTWWVSRTCPASPEAALPVADQAYLEAIARDTWRLFERCVVASEHHLPPDNLQVTPFDMVAHRTSPTNIGLYLLSVACARQFGWIGTEDLLDRLERTLATLHALERHRGHFLNWYDTQSAAPLLPMYVSTVDSGNLSGHLLAVAQACLELAAAPFDLSATQRARQALRARLDPLLAQRASLAPAQRDELKWLLADDRATRHSARRDAQTQTQTLPDAAGHPPGAADARRRLLALAQALRQLAWQADFSFLYNRKRKLFHIGYRVAEQQRDAGFYDLLASESRLTSLLAIARGDAPVRHWSSLGRLFYAVGSSTALRSWSGSMFEYLMPSLVLEEPYGSVLQTACQAALVEHMAFAKAQGVPWGISESAYAGSDHTLAYQYAPQGVPRLALRRTPPDELVIAPYATALASQIAPRGATQNFRALQTLGARGRYGFIEALDFSPARRTGDAPCTPVSTYMAHHQGMSIVALANVLLDGIAQRWGMADASLEAVSSLLQERVPREVSVLQAPPAGLLPQTQRRRALGLLREVVPGTLALAPTHLLSNGRYSVALRANGAGWSNWGRTGITRRRDDALRDDCGSFFYLRWPGTEGSALAPLVSLTQHPAPDPNAHYQCVYHADRVCFDATWPGLQAHTVVWVSPEDDIEFRQVELRNLTDEVLELELSSAFEVTLADPRADEAHPAFGNLFVSAEWLASQQALLMARKPRLPTELSLKVVHFLTDSAPQIVHIALATDRHQWCGRNQPPGHPLGRVVPPPTTDAPGTTLDTGLDPVCALAVTVRLAPHSKVRLTFATAASDNADTLRAVIDKYRQRSHVERASLMSATLTGIRLRTLRMNAETFFAVQTLSTALVLSLTRPQRQPQTLGGVLAGGCDKRMLWRFGLSGDRPIILVSAGVSQGLGLLRSLAQALTLWSWANVDCDLVVVNAEPASYLMALQRDISALRDRHNDACNAKGGVVTTGFYALRADELSSDELATLQRHARLRLQADGRPLLHHVRDWAALHEQAFVQRQDSSVTPLLAELTGSPGPASVTRSVGAFSGEGHEFSFEVGAAMRPARPWINVLSNPDFGAQISEAGGGYSWAVNSRLNQLTAWSNDPMADPPSEWFLLQDLRTMALWSVAPIAGSAPDLTYSVTHGQGYSVIHHRRGDLGVSATWCVDPDTSVKQVRLQLVNHGRTTLSLRVIGLAEWLMGANRSDRSTVQTAVLRPRTASGDKLITLLATQREQSAGFGQGTAFLALATAPNDLEDWTCDRRTCFDARGRLALPDHFERQSGDGLDPCAAIATRVVLKAGAGSEHTFLLGYGATPEAAGQTASLAASGGAEQRLERVRAHWDALLGATHVKTPDPLFDALVNRWLLYQTVSCRLWAKAGFYQAGGATGFRDQLQDAMALAWAAPGQLRAQILLCASRQFAEGDVQHWWHAPLGNGVRTHFSDDLLWLAHACVHYVQATGDHALLDQSVPFLDGATIPEGAEDAYFTPTVSAQTASVYEHAARAIDHSLRVGVHGLPLMGSGDWNDGMNRVGSEGRGESVWLGWFLCQLVAHFAPLAQQRGDTGRAQRWQSAAEGWQAALNGQAWDGEWFQRAYFDNGAVLGSQHNTEARIDLIAQAWSVLSNAAPLSRQHQAMTAVQTHLVDPQAGLIKLLDPPLSKAVPSAGYIQAYPPGVRENGGQYAHAGVWALMAQAQLATHQPNALMNPDLAYRYFTYLSPAHRTQHPTHGAAYGLEPYAMAGDVYTQPPYVGRGGWSWYTGAAAWLHRAAIESIFGLKQGAQTLVFQPCLPSHWPQAELTLVRDGHRLNFIFLRVSPVQASHQLNRWQATLLLPGQALAWPKQAPQSSFVIPLNMPLGQ